jgi:hypothetical protein
MPILTNTDLSDRVEALEGRIWEQFNFDAYTGYNETTSPIPMGFAVCQGTADNGLILPVDTNSVFKGFAVRSNVFEERTSTLNSDGRFCYPANNADLVYPITYLNSGHIWVPCSTAMAINADVFFVFTADVAVTGERVGMVRNSANTLRATEIPRAEVVRSTTAAGLVLIKINGRK